jgi:hypothetical protein
MVMNLEPAIAGGLSQYGIGQQNNPGFSSAQPSLVEASPINKPTVAERSRSQRGI